MDLSDTIIGFIGGFSFAFVMLVISGIFMMTLSNKHGSKQNDSTGSGSSGSTLPKSD